MDSKSKVLIWAFVIVFILVAGFKFQTIVSERNFVIDTHIACDNNVYSCFVTECDEESGEDCTNEVYAKIIKNGKDIPLCDKFKEDCAELTCEAGEDDCEIYYCSDETLSDGESCVGPVQNLIDEEITYEYASSTSAE